MNFNTVDTKSIALGIAGIGLGISLLTGCRNHESFAPERIPEATAARTLLKLNAITLDLKDIDIDHLGRSYQLAFDPPKAIVRIGDLVTEETVLDRSKLAWLGDDKSYLEFRAEHPMTESDEIHVGGNTVGSLWKIATSDGNTIHILVEPYNGYELKNALINSQGLINITGSFERISLTDIKPLLKPDGESYFVHDYAWLFKATSVTTQQLTMSTAKASVSY